MPDANPEEAKALNELGVSLQMRHKALGNPIDLDNAIIAYRQSIRLVQVPAFKVEQLDNLGSCLLLRFEYKKHMTDLDEAITVLQESVDAASDDRGKAVFLHILTKSLLDRFTHLEDIGDLDKAIAMEKQAVELEPAASINKSLFLFTLGKSYLLRFNRAISIQMEDINNAIEVLEQAVAAVPAGGPAQVECLTQLGDALFLRFHRLDDAADMEKAIGAYRKIDTVAPHGSPEKIENLQDLAKALFSRYSRFRKLDDLNEAIRAAEEALSVHQDFLPDGHISKPYYLLNLATAYDSRFHRLGQLDDLSKQILIIEQVGKLLPDDHANRGLFMGSLGSAFFSRFQHVGDVVDIDQAISLLKLASQLPSTPRSSRGKFLNTLGGAYLRRFQHLCEDQDLADGITALEEALELIPEDHTHKASCLTKLGNCLHVRFDHRGNLDDIDRAIAHIKQALKMIPEEHPNKDIILSALGGCFLARFGSSRDPVELDQAIAAQQQAIALLPDDHSQKPFFTTNLGTSFERRFHHSQRREDIDRAIETHQLAVDLLPDSHANRALAFNKLALCFETRFDHFGEENDIDKALTAYSEAAKSMSSVPSIRFHTAIRWGTLACGRKEPSAALEAYTVVLEMLPQLAWLGHKIERRYSEVRRVLQVGGAVNGAVATAIATGDLRLALEWLEEGRNIVWGQINQLRTPIDTLRDKDPATADRLQAVAKALESAGTSGVTAAPRIDDVGVPPQTIEEEATRHRALATEYMMLLKKARSLEGFEDFMKPKKFKSLLPAARDGPVAIINVHKSRCDALVLHSSDTSQPMIHIPLVSFSSERAEALAKVMHNILKNPHGRALVLADRVGSSEAMQFILAELWTCVVEPILKASDSLRKSGRRSHITWCMTGPLTFLPLHAAGIYNSGDHVKHKCVFDTVISSYIPTLSTLLRSREQDNECSTSPPRILLITQPSTPNSRPLPGTMKEVEAIRKHIPIKNIHHLNHSEATVSKVLDAMGEYSWLHLACHGIQDAKQSLKSGFALYDGRLDLGMLMTKSLGHARLAFLSACETAMGDEKLPEEAVHLAAGMLAAGFESVIATMWAIGDADAPVVAEAVYEILWRDGKDGGGERELLTAYALHEAVRRLREKVGVMEFIKWVPFVHFGVTNARV
ncbi:hypothetical protein M422DRAFT_777865 [Sphaerobolus stellatus SS14]|nr:hypothetical protein M422DRAFT_777865 [Sphaerobolus stellatus SS14]